MLVLLVSVVLLLLAVYTLNQGLNSLQTPGGDQTSALLYLSMTVVSFGLVTLTVLRARKGQSAGGGLTPKVLSVIRCAQCSFKQIKSFSAGDYVSKAEGRCSQCGNQSLFINGIYAEDLRKRPSSMIG